MENQKKSSEELKPEEKGLPYKLRPGWIPSDFDENGIPRTWTEDIKESYSEVIFSPKSNPFETNDVQLAVQGECLVIQRNIPVIIPDRFLDCARNGGYDRFEQLPDRPRKVVAHVNYYPFTVLRKGLTEQDYSDFRNQKQTVKNRASMPR